MAISLFLLKRHTTADRDHIISQRFRSQLNCIIFFSYAEEKIPSKKIKPSLFHFQSSYHVRLVVKINDSPLRLFNNSDGIMTCYIIYHVYNINNNQRRPLPTRYFDGNAPEEENYYRIWRCLELPTDYMNRGIVRTVKQKTGRQMFGLIPFVGAIRNAWRPDNTFILFPERNKLTSTGARWTTTI